MYVDTCTSVYYLSGSLFLCPLSRLNKLLPTPLLSFQKNCTYVFDFNFIFFQNDTFRTHLASITDKVVLFSKSLNIQRIPTFVYLTKSYFVILCIFLRMSHAVSVAALTCQHGRLPCVARALGNKST